MKKVLVTLLMVFALSTVFVSCEPEDINDDTKIQQTDKDKICPPGNPNC